MLRARIGENEEVDINGARTALEGIIKQGCKPPLEATGDDHRYAPIKGGFWNQEVRQLTCKDLITTLQETGNHLEAETVLKAVRTGNPYDDMDINVELVEQMKGRQAPLASSVPYSKAVADPTAKAPAHIAFYSSMLLASHYINERQTESALKYALQAALDDNVRGTPADGLARILLKRVHLLQALANGTLARHPRPAATLARAAGATGGWTYDGEPQDPTVDRKRPAIDDLVVEGCTADQQERCGPIICVVSKSGEVSKCAGPPPPPAPPGLTSADVADGVASGSEGIDYWSAAQALENADLFKQAYLSWNRPAIIGKGLLDNWPAMQHWTKESLLSGVRSNLKVDAQQTPYAQMVGEDTEEMTIKQFIETHMDREHEVYKSKSQPFYVFQALPDPTAEHYNQTETSMLTEDFLVPSVLQAPESWRKPKKGGPDLWLPLQHFFLGAKGSGAHLHAHVATFNALLYGRKHWFLIPPEYGMFDTHREQQMPIQRFLEVGLPAFEERGIKVIEFIQQAGEIVFVPHEWMHCVYNLEDSVGLSYQMGEEAAEIDWAVLRTPIVDMRSR